ncbi:MAG: DnaA regulatory inactivator Hda [Chromatiales bacterium]|jgi:DnaA family protein
MRQLPLRLPLDERADFEGFLPGPNAEPLALLQGFAARADEPFVYLWGPPGSGKSHLLQAVCHRAHREGATPSYLPLGEVLALGPDILEDMDRLDMVCIDDVERAAGTPEWERALFRLYNGLRDRGGRLLVSAERAPVALDLTLPDLRSRLSWGLVLRIAPLDDADKERLLMLSAARRGLDLSPEAARYLVSRNRRDLPALLGALDRLDELSLAARRRLTIPFIRRHVG